MSELRHPTLDPEAFEVLQAIARQPDSALLRAPLGPPRRALEVLLPAEPLRSTAAFLTAAERELLDVHREEVASWFRQAAFSSLHNEAGVRDRIHRQTRRSDNLQLPDAGALHQVAAEAALRARAMNLAPLIGESLLGAGQPHSPRTPSTHQLIASALRLEPHPSASLWLSAILITRGQYLAARRIAREYAGGKTDTLHRRIAEEVLASTAALSGSLADSLEHYRAASVSAHAGSLTAAWWLMCGLQADNRRAAEEARIRLEELGGCEGDAARSFGAALQAAAKQGGWRPTKGLGVRIAKTPLADIAEVQHWLAN